jgi:hypothetical protein
VQARVSFHHFQQAEAIESQPRQAPSRRSEAEVSHQVAPMSTFTLKRVNDIPVTDRGGRPAARRALAELRRKAASSWTTPLQAIAGSYEPFSNDHDRRRPEDLRKSHAYRM